MFQSLLFRCDGIVIHNVLCHLGAAISLGFKFDEYLIEYASVIEISLISFIFVIVTLIC